MKRVHAITALLLALILMLSLGMEAALADEVVQLQVKADFKYDDARKMLKLINDFRTGSDAWYIGEDNSTKVQVTGLGELEYDYELERVAMQRAVEIAAYFSHTRPDGSGWGTAFPSSYKTKGENLVYGYGKADTAFKALAEEDKGYSGQGHRRNMLRKEFTRVGFGAVKVGNVMYWVQSFGAGGSGASSKAEKYKSNKVSASADLLAKSSRSISAEVETLSVAKGETVSLPKVVIYSNSGAKLYVSGDWKTKDKKVAKVKSGKVSGVKKGKTSVEATVLGKKVKLPVEVTGKAKKEDIGEIIEDYDPPLGTDYMVIMEEDECFEIE